MFIILGVNLFTVRLLLHALGVQDLGIYNITSAIIIFFSFFTESMASATNRYFSFELGRNNPTRLNQLFCVSFVIYCIFIFVVIFFAETIGLWFLNTYINIPIRRIYAANWCYQFSIFALCFSVISIPYRSIIISNEHISAYAFIGVADAFAKAIIVFFVFIAPWDKLIFYGFLILVETAIISGAYALIARRKYEASKLSLYFDFNMFKEMLNYTGWNTFVFLSGVVTEQGVNILLNMFFGPIVNASRGIANQVNSALQNLVNSIFISVRPIITKLYASNHIKRMMRLVFSSSKVSYYLILFFILPLLFELPYVFFIWLTEIPEYLIIFTRLLLINTLINALRYPLFAAVQATGEIKKFQIVLGITELLNLPISFIILKLGYSPSSTFVVSIIVSIVCQIERISLINKVLAFPLKEYIRKVIIPLIYVTGLSVIAPLILSFLLHDGFFRLVCVFIMSFLFTGTIIIFIGLNRTERFNLFKLLKSINHQKFS